MTCYLFDNIFFSMTTKISGRTGSSRNQLASWIRICNLGLQIRVSGSERNVYRSTTLIVNMYFDNCPAMGARNQVGIGCRTGPPAYVAWLLNSRLGS
jgi:hypothetical protein